MIYRDVGNSNFVIQCDTCAVEDCTRSHNFHDGVENARGKGWEINRAKHGEWRHTCPACAEDVWEEDFDGLTD